MADASGSFSMNGSRTGKVGITASAASEVGSDIESDIDEELAEEASYSEDFNEATGTMDKSERGKEEVAAMAAVAASATSAAEDASYSEDFAEGTGTFDAARMEDKRMEVMQEEEEEEEDEEAKRRRVMEERRREIAKRQEADLSKTSILPSASASREEASLVSEEIPSEPEESFEAEEDEAESSMYDPDAKRREEEAEQRQRAEEQEKQRKTREAEELERKRKEDEANKKLGAERKRKVEEEGRQRKAEEEEKERKRKIDEDELNKKAEEGRKKKAEEEEEKERKRKIDEDELYKKAEEGRKKKAEEEEERKRKAEEEEERKKKVEEEESKKKSEEKERKRKAEEEKAEEGKRTAEEEERKKKAEEEQVRKKRAVDEEEEEEERKKRARELEEKNQKAEQQEHQRKTDKEEERKRGAEQEERKRNAEMEEQRVRAAEEDVRKLKDEGEDRRARAELEEQERKADLELHERQRRAHEEESRAAKDEEEHKGRAREEQDNNDNNNNNNHNKNNNDNKEQAELERKSKSEEDAEAEERQQHGTRDNNNDNNNNNSNNNKDEWRKKAEDEEQRRTIEDYADRHRPAWKHGESKGRSAARYPEMHPEREDWARHEVEETRSLRLPVRRREAPSENQWEQASVPPPPLRRPPRPEVPSDGDDSQKPQQQYQQQYQQQQHWRRQGWRGRGEGWAPHEEKENNNNDNNTNNNNNNNLWAGDRNSPATGSGYKGDAHSNPGSCRSGSRTRAAGGSGSPWSGERGDGWRDGDWAAENWRARSSSADPWSQVSPHHMREPSPHAAHPYFSQVFGVPGPEPHQPGFFTSASAWPPRHPEALSPWAHPCGFRGPLTFSPSPSPSPHHAPYGAHPLYGPSWGHHGAHPSPSSQAAWSMQPCHYMSPVPDLHAPHPMHAWGPPPPLPNSGTVASQTPPQPSLQAQQQQQVQQQPSTQQRHQPQQTQQQQCEQKPRQQKLPVATERFSSSEPEKIHEEETLWPSTILREGAGGAETALQTSFPDTDAADFSESMAGAVAAVVDEMLQLKYGCGINVADFAKMLLGAGDGYALLSVPRLVARTNEREIWASDWQGERKLRLHLSFRELKSFSELRRRLRLLTGTASAVAVVSAGGGYSVDAVAAFRTGCSDAGSAVGRCCRTSAARLLRHFGSDDFCSAVALDPAILAVKSSHGAAGSAEPAPPLTLEYRGLEALLQKDCSGGPPPAAVPTVPPALLAALHAAAPSPVVLRQAASALERPDVEPEAVLELLRKLLGWLRSCETPVVAAARRSLAEAPAHVALVAAMGRCSSQREICELGCQVLGRASRHHVENAAAFVGCGAAKLVCSLLEKHPGSKELQRHGLYALGCLAHYGGGALQATAAGAVGLTFRAMSGHRSSPSVQINGCEVLRCLAELGEAPMDELTQAAQSAKRVFPRDAAVHRAADLLLSFAVPRTAAAVGGLMDSAAMDEAVQRNGISSLGHLAGNGGVAWRGSSSVAVSRVLRAMGNHRSSAETQAVGLWALGRLAERVEAPAAGMQDAAERAKRQHPDSALVCRHADELIAYLLRPS